MTFQINLRKIISEYSFRRKVEPALLPSCCPPFSPGLAVQGLLSVPQVGGAVSQTRVHHLPPRPPAAPRGPRPQVLNGHPAVARPRPLLAAALGPAVPRPVPAPPGVKPHCFLPPLGPVISGSGARGVQEVITVCIVTLRPGPEAHPHHRGVPDGRPEAVTDPVEAGVAVLRLKKAGVRDIVR